MLKGFTRSSRQVPTRALIAGKTFESWPEVILVHPSQINAAGLLMLSI